MILSSFLRRLQDATGLPDEDMQALDGAVERVVEAAPSENVITEGVATGSAHVVLDGWACRYKLLPDGRRQIPALLLPGDIADLDGYLLRSLAFGVAALTPCRVAVLPHDDLGHVLDGRPALRDALWWLTTVDNAVATQWAVCLAGMPADERLAHLLCELAERMSMTGQAPDGELPLPISQQVLSEIMGISAVHVNRTLHELRADGLVTLAGRKLVIHDRRRLARLGNFQPGYLHREGWQPSRSADRRP